MKKHILFIFAFIFSFQVFSQMFAQPELYLLEPVNIAQKIDSIMYSEPQGVWGTSDSVNLFYSPHAITSDLVFSNLGTDSLGCDTFQIDINNKTVVVNQGGCSIEQKALSAQSEGALALLVIDTAETLKKARGNPMAYGILTGNFSSFDIKIPVLLISKSKGAELIDQIKVGNCKVFMGNKYGNKLLNNDLIIRKGFAASLPYSKMPHYMYEDSNHLKFLIGSDIANVGKNDISNVQLKAQIKKNGFIVYEEISQVISQLKSDSSYSFILPDYSDSAGFENYDQYILEYSILSDSMDSDQTDNHFSDKMSIGNVQTLSSYSKLSYCSINEEDELDPDLYFRNLSTSSPEYCINFKLPFMKENIFLVDNVKFNAFNGTGSIVDKSADINIYELDLDPLNWQVNSRTHLQSGSYTFQHENENKKNVSVYIPMNHLIQPNIHYQVCVAFSTNSELFMGYGNQRDYAFNYKHYTSDITKDQSPKASLFSATDSDFGFIHGFGSQFMPAIEVTIGWIDDIAENDKSSGILSPNPASDLVKVSLENVDEKDFNISVYDASGRVVQSKSYTNQSEMVEIDISFLKNGYYTLVLEGVHKTRMAYKLVISK
ncbi:MAG: T9SS type A sorting domain-containing protein [Flavobacteriales bacterium]|jgi:hypothetical protein|nr:T9SS type A sorting domain-containing protein [Flavobacteriales bacterium]